MTSTRTDNRRKKRQLLNEISKGFLMLFNGSDNQIERIPLIQLQGVKINMENFKKWSRIEEREVIEPHLYANDGDGAAYRGQTKVFFNVKKDVKA